MHVNITKQKNHFFLKGDLKNSNSKKVKKKINNFFKKNHSVTLNISEVKEMDSKTVNSIVNLFTKAIDRDKEINLVGYGTKDIYDELMTRNII